MGRKSKILRNQSGATLVLVGLLLVVLAGVTALAIDIGHLLVVRNQLQNAADAGALAGAGVLYNADGTAINEGANQVAHDMAVLNLASSTAGEIPVEAHWQAGTNEGDIQRGHWSFATRKFTPNASTVVVETAGKSAAELDADPDFINALRVRTRRERTPVAAIFAGIFGFRQFSLSTEAVAYLGFTGTIEPHEVDQPIGICMESIMQDGEVSCNIGRMINSGANSTNSETGGWTSFDQDNPCSGGTNANEVKSLICGTGNPESINVGVYMATNGGEIQAAFNKLIDCWEAATGKTRLWKLALPVISCPGNNVGTCEKVMGAVYVNIVWITGAGEDPGYNAAPVRMEDWSFPADAGNTNGAERWSSFVEEFNLMNVDGSPAPYQKKAIYFMPDCTPHELKGQTGGQNFGIQAKRPVLVNRPDDN